MNKNRNLLPLGDFKGDVELSCEGLPPGMRCAILAHGVSLPAPGGRSAGTSTAVTILTSSSKTTALALALFAEIGFGKKRKLFRLISVLMFSSFLLLNGCGGLDTFRPTITTKGNYTILIIAKSGDITHRSEVVVRVR